MVKVELFVPLQLSVCQNEYVKRIEKSKRTPPGASIANLQAIVILVSQCVLNRAGDVEIRPKGTCSRLVIEVNHGLLLELFICKSAGLLRPLSQRLKPGWSVRLRAMG